MLSRTFEGCPKGYHSEYDETGQCYPNDYGCPEGVVMANDGDNCIDESICEFL